MRILGELPQEGLKVSVFKTDSRILIKIEDSFLEQTYKFRETDGLSTLSDVRQLLTPEFLAQVRLIFKQMQSQHLQVLQNHLQIEADDLPVII